ncbi:hypothetical protein CRYUN_Cryun25bG0126900 [Craigia yunnanensis]
MGDLATLAKAKMELEELYLNLSFQDLADMKQKVNASKKKKSTSNSMDLVQEAKNPKQGSPLTKLPSIDFKRGLQATKDHSHYHQHLHHNHHLEHGHEDDNIYSHMDMRHHHHRHHDSENMHAWYGHRYGSTGGDHQSYRSHATSPRGHTEFRPGLERSVTYDGVSVISMASTYQREDKGAGLGFLTPTYAPSAVLIYTSSGIDAWYVLN